MKRSFVTFMLATCFAFVACSTSPISPSRNQNPPILKSNFLEKQWGPARSTPDQNGGHEMMYQNPTNSLAIVMIESLPNAERIPNTPPPIKYLVQDPKSPHGTSPRERPQPWRHTSILGHRTKWFQVDEGGGADWPAFETVVFPLTHPDGRTGHYRIRVLATNPPEAAKFFPRVNW